MSACMSGCLDVWMSGCLHVCMSVHIRGRLQHHCATQQRHAEDAEAEDAEERHRSTRPTPRLTTLATTTTADGARRFTRGSGSGANTHLRPQTGAVTPSPSSAGDGRRGTMAASPAKPRSRPTSQHLQTPADAGSRDVFYSIVDDSEVFVRAPRPRAAAVRGARWR